MLQNTPVIAEALFTIVSIDWLTPLPSTKFGAKIPVKLPRSVTSSRDKKSKSLEAMIPLLSK